jgi:hypothetical protein
MQGSLLIHVAARSIVPLDSRNVDGSKGDRKEGKLTHNLAIAE